jgi:hypothetical protein
MQTTPQNKFKPHHIPYSPSQKQKRHSTIETHLKIIPKTLNRPKEMNAVSTKVLLRFFPPVCTFAPRIFSQVTPRHGLL